MDEMRHLCAWDGCAESYGGDMPSNWRSLMVYWVPQPVMDFRAIAAETWDRDAVLCPEHVRVLDSQLKDIGRWTNAPVAGQA